MYVIPLTRATRASADVQAGALFLREALTQLQSPPPPPPDGKRAPHFLLCRLFPFVCFRFCYLLIGLD